MTTYKYLLRLPRDLFERAQDKAGLTPLAPIVRGLIQMFVDGAIEKGTIEEYQRKAKSTTLNSAPQRRKNVKNKQPN